MLDDNSGSHLLRPTEQGRQADAAHPNLLQHLFSAYPDTEQVFTSCFANATPKGNAKDGIGTKADTKTDTVDEIKSFLDGHIKLRYNEITARVEYLESEKQRERSEEQREKNEESWLLIKAV